MDLRKEKTVKIPFSSLKKALEKSRFHAVTWEEILVNYDRKPLLSNKEEQVRKREVRDRLKESCLNLCRKEDTKIWLSGLLFEKKSGYRIIEQQLETNSEVLIGLLKNVICALEHLPVEEGKKRLLPVYAAEMTGNPHYFDEGTTAGRLLLNYGEWRFGQAKGKMSGIEQRESVLYQLGILKDDLSNLCLAYGICGMKANGDIHEGLEGFCRERQAVQMTLNTLGSLSRLEAAENARHMVYVIENPSVFSYLTGKYPQEAFLCTNGQLKLAGYMAMDLFAQNYNFYYAGDFDPEGLQIAQGLKKRYGERLLFWNYKRKYYEQAVSQLTLGASRLKKLAKIEAAELEEIKNCLLTYKRPAYQEKMLGTYVIE